MFMCSCVYRCTCQMSRSQRTTSMSLIRSWSLFLSLKFQDRISHCPRTHSKAPGILCFIHSLSPAWFCFCFCFLNKGSGIKLQSSPLHDKPSLSWTISPASAQPSCHLSETCPSQQLCDPAVSNTNPSDLVRGKEDMTRSTYRADSFLKIKS